MPQSGVFWHENGVKWPKIAQKELFLVEKWHILVKNERFLRKKATFIGSVSKKRNIFRKKETFLSRLISQKYNIFRKM